MNIMVIGGAGYIGSHIVYELIDSGHSVTILDNFSTGMRENVDERARLIEGDMQDLALLKRLFDGSTSDPFDSVFHFAALKAAGESMQEPEKYTSANTVATLNLLNMMMEHDIKNFVFSSSAATYGDPEYLPIDEKHPLKPVNYYGYTKLAIEQALEWYSRLRNLRYAALRYFNAAGYDIHGRITGKERNPANLLPIVMEVAAGIRPKMNVFGNDYPTRDGTCIRDYIHVNDLATAHVKAMEYLESEKRDLVLNLATGKGYTVLEVISESEKVSGRRVAYDITSRREGDPAELVAVSALAKTTIDWKAQHSGLSELVESMWNIYKQK
ncbi:MAG: UDP-glucose 4-epimerase GalE [Rhodothermaceae bacterium]|nr:UDP-glucose 4-epimerase GalE [Rhodothermaceae bacterium]